MEKTLLDKIGGKLGLNRIVGYWYERILNDVELSPFFEKTDINWLKQKVVSFLEVLLIEGVYKMEEQIHQAHAHLGIQVAHFNAFIGHLDMALDASNINKDTIEDIIDLVLETKEDILSAHKIDEQINQDHGNQNQKRIMKIEEVSEGHNHTKSTFKKKSDMTEGNTDIYHGLLLEAEDAILTINQDQNILFWNKAAEELLGYSAEEVMGGNINAFSFGELIQLKLNQDTINGVDEMDRNDNELVLERKDGSKLLILISMSKLKQIDDTYFMLTLKDITTESSKVAEKSLEILDQAIDAIVTVDGETKAITFFNKAAEKMWGYSREEVLGNNINTILPAELTEHHDGYIDEHLRTGVNNIIGIGRDLEMEHRDGTRLWINLAITKVKVNGKTSFTAFIKDISEQRDTVLNLQGLKSTVDTSFARVEFDPQGNILNANQNFASTYGYESSEELIGKHHSILVDKAYSESPEYVQFWEDLRSGIVQKGEFKRLTKGGEVLVQAAYTPLTNKKGEVIKVIKIAIDVTSQKRFLQEINKVIISAGERGKLDARLDASQASGDWKELASSVNLLLESVSMPIMEISDVVGALAKGDLTERFDSFIEGDIKNLGDELNKAIDSINVLMGQISQIGNLVAASAEEMLVKGEEMKNTTQEVASATQQMAEGAQQQAQQTDEASKMMDNVLKTVEVMAQKAGLINKSAVEGQKNSSEGLSTIKLVANSMNEIQDSAVSTSDSIEILSERSDEIASALSVITDIAAQTNLLALNAAIEAARAGDAGRGFAVVAEEIRKLAEGSKKSAVDIEKVIREIQKDITMASKAIDSMELNVKSGMQASQEAQAVFESIEKASHETLDLSNEIVEATEDQKDSIHATARNIEKIVVVAEETASGTEQVASSSKVLSQGMNEVTATSEDLANVANQLQESISKFKLQ